MIHIDFETFSTAGYTWDPIKERWGPLEGAKKSGLPTVGAEVYALHPSTRIVCMAWDDNIWWPGDPLPLPLLQHVKSGGMLSACNSAFEYWVWRCVLVKRGWPELPLKQIVDVAPRARAWSMPGSLANMAKVMQIDAQKDTVGKSLMRKFSMPRNPTKLDKRLVYTRKDLPIEAAAYGGYCLQDVTVETSLSRVLPELSPLEQRVWELDQEINVRGIPVDMEAVDNACEILRQAARVLNAELAALTDGAVTSVGQHAKLRAWCNGQGLNMTSTDKDAVKAALAETDVPPDARRVLEIRQELGSTSTAKVWAFKHRTATTGRAYGQFLYGGAARTLRWAGYGTQPHNFPRGDAKVRFDEMSKAYGIVGGEPVEWGAGASEQFIDGLKCQDYNFLARRWGDVLKAMASSLRGLFRASPDHRFVSSDYSAIEAVVLAVLAGEQWRIDVFNGHGKIYETSASKITGVPLEKYLAYKEREGKHHPDRQGLGKLAELASGYGGSIGAWRNFGADKFFTPERCEEHRAAWEQAQIAETERIALHGGRRWVPDALQDYAIQLQVKAWRKASPNIAKFWDGLLAAAISAVRNPGQVYHCRSISFQVEHGTLYCKLPSGRRMAYHNARVGPGKFGSDVVFYHGWGKKTKTGPSSWLELDTYGGKLAENVVQAVSRDLLAWGMLKVAEAGYSIVMHIHDEIVCEEPEGHGSVAELERLMMDLPPWAAGWPIRAKDGWEGMRFRK